MGRLQELTAQIRAPWVAGIIVFGAWLRIDGLGEWPLGGDEVYTLNEAEQLAPAWQGEASVLEREQWARLTNPLLLAATSFCVAGFGPELVSIRLASLIAGLVALALLPVLVARTFGSAVARAFLVILAVCPWHVSMCRYARYETLSFLFSGVALLCTLHWRQDRSRWRSLATAIFALLGLVFSHVTGVFVAAVLLGAILIASWSSRRLRIAVSITAVALAVLFLPGLRLVVVELAALGTNPRAGELPLRPLVGLGYDLGLVLCGMAVLGFLCLFRKRHAFRWILLAVVVLPALALTGAAFLVSVGPRYYAGVLPAVLLAGAWAARGDGASLGGHWKLAAILLGAAPLLVANQMDDQRYPYPAAAHRVNEVCRPDDLVFAEQHSILDYYLDFATEELPSTVTELEERVREHGERRAVLVVPRQRGTLVGVEDPAGFDVWSREHARSHRTYGVRRPDSWLRCYELEVWEVVLASGAGSED